MLGCWERVENLLLDLTTHPCLFPPPPPEALPGVLDPPPPDPVVPIEEALLDGVKARELLGV